MNITDKEIKKLGELIRNEARSKSHDVELYVTVKIRRDGSLSSQPEINTRKVGNIK